MPVPRTVFGDGSTPAIPYPDLRNQIKDGDLLLCSGTAVFSKLIQQATSSIWSHVGFLMWLPTAPPRLMVVESVESVGVRSVPVSSYMTDYCGTGTGYPGRLLVARHSDCADHPLTREFVNFAVDRFGWPYANADIVQIAASIASPSYSPYEPAAFRYVYTTNMPTLRRRLAEPRFEPYLRGAGG